MRAIPFDSSLATLKALADATRLKLVGLIAERERSVGDLAKALNLKEPTISHHLARLQERNLVSMRTEGTVHFYRLNPTALQRIGQTLARSAKAAADKIEERGETYDEKILRTYVHGGVLTKIPDDRKKRDVILRWLVTIFDVGKRYTGAEVRTMLKRVHPDFLTLRHELVVGKLMRCENNVYWRERDDTATV